MAMPDLSPEAVEWLAREFDNWATIAEADRDMEIHDAEITGERPDLRPILVEVDLRDCRAAAATLRALAAEIERLRDAIYPFADFAHLIDEETTGFADYDEFELPFNNHLMTRFSLQQFRRARTTLKETRHD